MSSTAPVGVLDSVEGATSFLLGEVVDQHWANEYRPTMVVTPGDDTCTPGFGCGPTQGCHQWTAGMGCRKSEGCYPPRPKPPKKTKRR